MMAGAAVPSVKDDLEKDIDFLLTSADLQRHRESFIHLGVFTSSMLKATTSYFILVSQTHKFDA